MEQEEIRLGIGFVVALLILAIFATLFPEKKDP